MIPKLPSGRQPNFLVAFLLVIIVWLGSELWLRPSPPTKPYTPPPSSSKLQEPAKSDPLAFCGLQTPSVPPSLNNQTFSFENRAIQGLVNVSQGRIELLKLKNYTEEDSKTLKSLLEPNSQKVFFKWYSDESLKSHHQGPSPQSVWTLSGKNLEFEKPITASWVNADGVTFQYEFSIDKQYLLTIKQRILNGTKWPVRYGSVVSFFQTAQGDGSKTFYCYEGPLGFLKDGFLEIAYEKLEKSPKEQQWRWLNPSDPAKSLGWIGKTDRYWLYAFASPDLAKGRFYPSSSWNMDAKTESSSPAMLETQCLHPAESIHPGSQWERTTHIFVGPKSLPTLSDYEKNVPLKRFDLAIDFGWFYFLTKPLLLLLLTLKNMLGSFAWALVAMTLLIKILLFPMALKSHRSMSKMKTLQPAMEKLKALYGNDRLRLNQEMMALYKKEKVNPASGCLPMLLQIPVFFALCKVLSISVEMRHAPFWGWIKDLSSPDPTSVFNLFGLLPFALPQWLHIGIWPILMGASMIVQQKMTAQPAMDRHQTLMLTYFMPAMFVFTMGQLPSGLLIYWTLSNLFTILQQWITTRYVST